MKDLFHSMYDIYYRRTVHSALRALNTLWTAHFTVGKYVSFLNADPPIG